MVLTFNRKRMSPFVEPDNGGSNEPSEPETKPEDEVYENAEIEQGMIAEFTTDHAPTKTNSMTLNLINFLSDFDTVAGSMFYRTSEKESKGAENLANGKPRYYPTVYIKAMKEQIVEPEPDEPVDPPADPAPAQ